MFFQSNCVNRRIRGVVATDFDGTLLQSDHTVSERSRITLEMLGERDVLRVIATGRSYFSLRKVLKENLPVDYLIVASGAGIYCRNSKKLIYRTTLSPEDTEHIGSSLIKMGCDFMVHYPLPENHKFLFYKKSSSNKDYEARFEIYREYGKPLSGFSELKEGSSQFLVVDHPGSQKYRSLVSQLSGYTVIRTTS
ncbi:MAG: HAD family hydrolase, partial [Spirochaetales bacterium]|nr:HAD family hydrolase [Spirochaetales bacterium]